MPAAKKRTATKKASTKPRVKSNVKSSVAKTPKINWAVIGIVSAVLVLIGALYVLFSQAGTTVNYKVADGSIVPRRFPGDPNPRVTKKAYWGADQLENTTYKTRFEDVTGTSMSTVRRFYSSWDQRSKLPTQAKEDISLNRLPMYSIKPVGWEEMATSSTRQAEIDSFLKSLDTAGGPVWLIVHHEPDGGGSKVGPRNEDDPGGAAAWVKMQKKFRERMNAVGTKNIALMAAMTGGFGGDLNQPKDNWWADNTFDAFLLDHYTYDLNNPVANHRYWKGFYEWADLKKIPYGTAELGIRSGGADGVGYFLPTTDCSKLTPRGISADLDNKAGDRLREFWNWSFVNNKDVIAHAYFDKCVNSGDSPYALGGRQLEVFREILKQGTTSGKVQRVKDLGVPTTSTASPTTTTTVTPTTTTTPSPSPSTGTLNISITAPAAGATVKGPVTVTAGPDTNVNEVSFRLDGVWQTTDTAAPFAWDWNTTTVANGEHTLTIRARKVGDPGDVYTEKSIKVNVSNATTSPSPTPTPTTDTTKPTAPSNVKGGVVFDPLKFTYYTNLTWAAAYDNVGVASYDVKRNGTSLGTSTTTSFKDFSLQPNTLYTYEVFAQDAAGNVSLPGTARLTGRCFLVWCWAE